MAGRATVIISHNLVTVREATSIVVLDQGRVVERGTHEELLRHEGRHLEELRLRLLREAQALARLSRLFNDSPEIGLVDRLVPHPRVGQLELADRLELVVVRLEPTHERAAVLTHGVSSWSTARRRSGPPPWPPP